MIDSMARPQIDHGALPTGHIPRQASFAMGFLGRNFVVREGKPAFAGMESAGQSGAFIPMVPENAQDAGYDRPLGRVIGQYGNKYIIAESEQGLVIVDQHAAHERIVYESLRMHSIKVQPLLAPIVANMRPEQTDAVMTVRDEMKSCGLTVDRFGDDAIAIFEKPADWDLDWQRLLVDIADEVAADGHSSRLYEKLHLKLANHACHHSVRAGQRLDRAQMDALLRDVENTERAGQCNHGRPVYKIIRTADLDALFERI
jgi:DNA mismatch repair protein MutL